MAATSEQYRVVQSVPLIPVGIAFFCTFLLSETPRYLITRDREAEAHRVLARLRGSSVDDPVVVAEFQMLREQMMASTVESRKLPTMELFREIWSPRYRGRFLLAIAFQTVAQWSGGNGITYYVPQIFRYAGVTGDSVALLSSGAYGIVKLVSTVTVAFFLIDRVGRRPFFLTGLALQMLTHIYMAAYMGSQPGSGHNHAASNAAIASVFIYAFGWSIGLCIVQSIYGTEIFPTRLRGICYSIIMALHWFFQFAVVRVTPNMFAGLDVWGAYVFWAAICSIGFVILGLWAPETKQVPLENMDDLFQGPWYMTWKAKASEEEMVLDRIAVEDAVLKKGLQRPQVQHVESGE